MKCPLVARSYLTELNHEWWFFLTLLHHLSLLWCVQVFDQLSSGVMWGLMRELPVPPVSATECLTVSSRGSRDSSRRVWLGGGSSAQKRGSVTAVDPDSGAVSTQVRTGTPFFNLKTSSKKFASDNCIISTVFAALFHFLNGTVILSWFCCVLRS